MEIFRKGANCSGFPSLSDQSCPIYFYDKTNQKIEKILPLYNKKERNLGERPYKCMEPASFCGLSENNYYVLKKQAHSTI